MLDQKDKAMAVWNKMLGLSGKKSHFDPVVLRQTKRYIASGGHFAAFELLYLRRDLAKMIPIMPAVLKALDNTASRTRALEPFSPKPSSAKNSPTNKMSFGGFKSLASGALNNLNQLGKKKEPVDFTGDDRASYLLLKGSILKALNKHDEAIDCFKEVIIMQDQINEKLYLPYCLYELGESYYVKGQLKEAEENMHRCSKINGYDWEDPLKIRLRVTMDQLRKGTKPSEQTYASIESMVGNSTDDDKDSLDEPKSDDELEDDDEKKIKEVESD